jgi:peroxiredoxin
MMNRYFLLVVFYLFCFPLFSQEALQFFPEKPSPGEKIMLKYDLEHSPFDQAEDMVLIAYFKENGKLRAEDVYLQKQGPDHVATIQTTAQTKVLLLRVVQKDKELDSQSANQTYPLLMYDDDQEPVQGAYFNLGYQYYYEAAQVVLERDTEKGQMLMEKEFALHPEAKSEPDYMGPYASIMVRKQGEEGVAELRELAESWSKNKAGEQKMTYAYHFLQKLGDQEAAQKLGKKIRRKYPHGMLVKEDVLNDFWESRDNLEAAEKNYARFERLVNPASEEDVKALSYMATRLATAYGESGNWIKFDKYAGATASGLEVANTFNSLAWGMARQAINTGTEDLQKALELSERSLELVESSMEDPGLGKPDILTTRQWGERLQNFHGMFADTYALIQYQMGDFETALKYQEIALEKSPPQSPEFYERHAICVERVRGGAAAEALLADLIQKGMHTSAMKAQFKRLFLANNTLESAFDKHLALLEKQSLDQLRSKLAGQMLHRPAPDFKLTNLKGDEIRLSELKGKVVVLDFWATWCQPCIQSFSSMKKLMEKYTEEEVVFLFINSWESGVEKEKGVSDFLKKNGFDHFNVPLDKDDAVIEAFKVSGIPTTFVISPEGSIRFKVMGFDASNERQMKELELMIELAGL